MTTAEIYRDGSYAASHPTWHTERSVWKASQICKLLDQHNVRPTSILDIGCGAGHCLKHVAEKFNCVAESLGIEPSPDVASKVKANAVRIEQKSVHEVDRKFDLAMMLDVFEHVEDYLGFLKEARPKARWFGFHIPLDIYALRVLSGRMTNSRRQHGHLHYFTKETAIATLQDAGYEIVGWNFTAAAFEGPNRNPNSPRNLLTRFLCKLSPALVSRTIGGLSLAVLASSEKSG